MNDKEKEYKELFIAEAIDNYESLNNLLTTLEKDKSNQEIINSIFRITHTLKGNATGMGFRPIAEITHVLEDLFEAIKNGEFELELNLFNDLFKAIDVLGACIKALNTDRVVRYKGIKTKLSVYLRNKREGNGTAPEETMAGNGNKRVESQSENKIASAAKNTLADTQESLPVDDSEIDDDDEEVPEITFSEMVQIPVRKLDNLMNLVGELVIERDRLAASINNSSRTNELTRLNRISSDLQYSVMDVRLVQVGFLFNKFHRVVRDAANVENKKVELLLEGTETEIDRNILQIMSDSLIHLIRNAIGHGVELPDERKLLGKNEVGVVTLSARNESDSVIVEIQDDGNGIDVEKIKQKAIEKGLLLSEMANNKSEQDILMYIFEPGFSSAEKVNAISGRGVGMDVVKRAIDSIGGNVEIETQLGKGTLFRLLLPSSMAVKSSLLLEECQVEYAIPLIYTEAVISVRPEEIFEVSSKIVVDYLGQTISVHPLKQLLFPDSQGQHSLMEKKWEMEKIQLVVVSCNGKMMGIVVEKLLQQKEIVEKPLQPPLEEVKHISGVTILGNGHVCLVLNIPYIMSNSFSIKNNKKGVVI